MRIPEKNENLIGKICVCSVGRVFIVTGKSHLSGTNVLGWCGLGLDGKGTAWSSNPCVLSESGQEFHDKLLHLFGGKMSPND